MGILLWDKHWSGLAAATGLCNRSQVLCLGVLVSPRRTRAKERMPPCNLEPVHLQAVSPVFGRPVCLQVSHLTRGFYPSCDPPQPHTLQ